MLDIFFLKNHWTIFISILKTKTVEKTNNMNKLKHHKLFKKNKESQTKKKYFLP